MDKNTILNYVTETPGNTNRAILRSMLNSISSEVEMVTLFEEDINLEYYFQYTANAGYRLNNVTLSMSEGYIKVTLDDIVTFGVVTSEYNYQSSSFYLRFSATKSNYHLFSDENIFSVGCETGLDGDSLYLFYYFRSSSEQDIPELQAYCQEPHHLKIEWFII